MACCYFQCHVGHCKRCLVTLCCQIFAALEALLQKWVLSTMRCVQPDESALKCTYIQSAAMLLAIQGRLQSPVADSKSCSRNVQGPSALSCMASINIKLLDGMLIFSVM